MGIPCWLRSMVGFSEPLVPSDSIKEPLDSLDAYSDVAKVVGATSDSIRELIGDNSYYEAENIAETSGFGQEYLEKVLEKYHEKQRQAVEVAVVGAQGVGKSSLINALRDLPHDDEDAAPVGVTETTVEARRYPHFKGRPEEKGVVYVDNPGRDAAAMSKADVVLIVTCTRFTPFDRTLVARCIELHKSFFFVRTKVDLDILNERQAKPRKWSRGEISEHSVLAKIRSEIVDNMQELFPQRSDGCREFLVNCQSSLMSPFDLCELRESIARCLPLAKSLEFLRIAPLMSEEIIECKRVRLQDDIKLWTNLSAMVFGSQPIPLLGSAASWGWLVYWKNFLATEFGCDDLGLHRLFERLNGIGLNPDALCSIKSLIAANVMGDCAEAMYMSGSLMCCKTKVLFPVAGSVACGLASIGLMRWAIKTMINQIAEFALNIQQLVMEAIRLSEVGFEIWVDDTYRLVPTLEGSVTLSMDGTPLHLVFELDFDDPPGQGRLTTFNNRVLTLCIVPVGDTNHLSLCVPTQSARRRTRWRRSPVRDLYGAWKWTFEAEEPEGYFLTARGTTLQLEKLDVEALREASCAHFFLRTPNLARAKPSFCFG